MSTHQYEYTVTMTCTGCSGAVNRVLTKLEGVKAVDISLETQLVKVTTDNTLTYDAVLEKIAKTGKKVVSGKTIA